MTPLSWGALVGLALSAGVWLVADRMLRTRRPSLASRVYPYVRDVPSASVRWHPVVASGSAAHALVAIARPAIERGAQRLERILGGRESIRRRLERAGQATTVEEFRFSQVLWGMSGAAAALVVGLTGPAREPGRALPWLVVCAGTAIVCIVARDGLLTRHVTKREELVLAEFPAVADLLALAVAAGEGPVGALERVVVSCRGALPDDLSVVLAESRTGVPISTALDSLARRSGLAIVSRFAEGLAVAIERGTPLVDVLTAQAADVREAAKRSLIEAGARKEVAMMVPVVFLIMPVTLLFTIY